MDDDDEYAAIVDRVDWMKPQDYSDDVEPLRKLAARGHAESMNLLAILLGDMDSSRYRDEIISLYERSYRLGSYAAARSISIQYWQWNEPFLSRLWEHRAREREGA